MTGACSVTEHALPSGHRAVALENGLVAVTVLPAKGADIYSLVYKPGNVDVLWKSPWTLRPPRGVGFHSGNSEAAWMDEYAGGWQMIFPNGGDECVYRNAPLGFHGEASTSSWDYRILESNTDCVSAEFRVGLRRMPFDVTRRITIERMLPGFRMDVSITNRGEEDLHFMWGEHPALGGAFLEQGCALRVPARAWISHHQELSPHARIAAGHRGEWPLVMGKSGSTVDLSNIPARGERIAEYGYLSGLDEGWYGITSIAHGFGFGLSWPTNLFPYLWYWQELRGSFGYPWYGRCSVFAIEPFTSIPGNGLVEAIAAGTAPTLAAGQTRSAEIAAVFYEENGRTLEGIRRDGSVRWRVQ